MVRAQTCDTEVGTSDDLTICAPGCVDLMGEIDGDYLEFEWTSDHGYSNTSDLNPCAQVDELTEFTLEVSALSNQNLIENGDFEDGNTGFFTDYYEGITMPDCYGEGYLDCEGSYGIETNPNDGHNGFAACDDHTSGNGNMMVVNGASGLQNVWCQTINVNPSTSYVFTAWVTSVNSSSPAILQFAIDGVLIGNNFNATSTTCIWEEFYATWDSGGSTSIEICITNQNFATGGNDFALDDIGFFEICQLEESFTVDIQSLEVSVYADLDVIDCNNPTTMIFADADPQNVGYDWDSLDGMINGPTDQSSITVGQQGLYSLTITDENGCTAEADYLIGEFFDVPEISPLPIADVTCSNPLVSLEFVVVNWNFGDLDIEWFSSEGDLIDADTQIITVEGGGVYTAIITGVNGCSTEVSLQVLEDLNIPSVSIDSLGALDCNNAEMTLIANSIESDLDYQWNNGADTSVINITTEGEYIVTVTASNGCSAEDTIQVVNDLVNLEVDLVDSLLDCNNLSYLYNPLIAGSYDQLSWTLPDASTTTDISIIVQQAGTYILELIDENDCVVIDSMHVVIDTIHPIVTHQIDSISCSSPGVITIDTLNASSIIWDINGTIILDSLSISSSVVSEAHLTLIGGNGCTTETDLSFVSNESVPDFSLEANAINCLITESNVEITTSDNLDFDWVGPNGFTSSESSFLTMAAGNYFLTVSDDNGCEIIDSLIIQIDTLAPEMVLDVSNVINCYDDTAEITNASFNPLINYQWSFESEDLSGNGSSFVAQEEGFYLLEALGDNFCSTIDSIYVELDTLAPEVDLMTTDIDCLNEQAFLQVSNPSSNHSYSWMLEGSTSDQISWMSDHGGMGEIEVVNSDNGCSTIEAFEVAVDTMTPELIYSFNDINCADSIAYLELINPQAQLEYLWIQGTQSSTEPSWYTETGGLINLSATNPENGCDAMESFEIQVDTLSPEVSLSTFPMSCLNPEAEIVVNGFSGEWQLEWFLDSDLISESTPTHVTSTAGDYVINITNPTNFCQAELSTAIIPYFPLAAEIEAIDPNCLTDTGSLNVLEVNGGSPAYRWSIDGGVSFTTDEQITDLEVGNYNLIIIDEEDCELELSFTIENFEPLAISILDTLMIDNLEAIDPSLQLNIDLEDISTIEWSPSELVSCTDCLNPNYLGNDNGDLFLTITDIYGCTASARVHIIVPFNYSIYIPNVFSPHREDGNNDFFYPFADLGKVQEVEYFAIFNRWGERVFLNEHFPINDPSEGWNGTFKDQDLNPSVFAYVTEIRLVTGELILLKGDVTLVD